MFIKIKKLTKIYNKYLAVNKINFELQKIKLWDYWTKWLRKNNNYWNDAWSSVTN